MFMDIWTGLLSLTAFAFGFRFNAVQEKIKKPDALFPLGHKEPVPASQLVCDICHTADMTLATNMLGFFPLLLELR